ncbi:MAG: DUF3006 domain-containing protein [Myxococcales bacterium]|nr:DUF3006 domain-containing protein [Myxococcales bacterium]
MRRLALALWIAGCGETSPRQVELLEDERAVVTDLESGRTYSVPRASLPRGAREGEVVAHGKVDRRASAEAKERVRRARRKLLTEPPPR